MWGAIEHRTRYAQASLLEISIFCAIHNLVVAICQGKVYSPEYYPQKLKYWRKYMKIMSFSEFLDSFGKAVKPSMNMSIYRDEFKCSCGESHWFDESINIVCDGFQKVMVTCPNDSSYLTSLKIKTFMMFKFKGFESLAGTRIKNQQENDEFAAIRVAFFRR